MSTYWKRAHGLIVPVLSLLMVLALAAGCPTGGGVPGPPGPPGPGGSNIGGLFPGIVVQILGVTIPTDRRPVVAFTAMDSKGNILALSEFTDVRFVLDYLEAGTNGDTSRFVSYVTNSNGATYDSARLTTSTTGGVTQDADTGEFSYRFAKVLPLGYPSNLTHQLGCQARRMFGGDGMIYPTNEIFRFRPDGGKDLDTREIVFTENCNNCHTRLSIHGIRREVQYCILCHNKQTFDDAGEPADFPVMIHKIHRGEGLPSVEGGTPYMFADNDFSGVAFPQDIRHCDVCHEGSKSDFINQNPTKEGCGSCHDRTWFGTSGTKPAGYTLHADSVDIPGGIVPLSDNSACVTCHADIEALTADVLHETPVESDDAPGLHLDITDVFVDGTSVAKVAPVLKVEFTVSNNSGPILNLDNNIATPAPGGQAPLVLTNYKGLSISVLTAWPTTDYEHYISQSAVSINATGTTITLPSGGAILEEMGGGVYRYTFKPDATHPIPSASPDPGTFAAALAGRVNFVHDGSSFTQGTDSNGLTYFTLDGSKALEPRREIVDDGTKCNKCHGELRAHGEQRYGLNLCVMCHNPVTSDVSKRVASGDSTNTYPPLSVHFKSLIHHIHRGEDLESPYTIYGYNSANAPSGSPGTPYDFTEVLFPGLEQQCDICHVKVGEDEDEPTWLVPLPEDALPTTFSYTPYGGSLTTSTTLPTRQACVACHDGLDANLHMVLQSDLGAGTESCAVCHEEGADFAVSKVHALEP